MHIPPKGTLLFLLLLLPGTLFSLEAYIDYFEGKVTVFSSGEELEAEFGMSVYESDSITTESGATAVLSLPYDRIIKLGENTHLNLQSLSESTQIRLSSGSLFSKVNRLLGKGYSVRTPSMAAGVRGTEFFIAFGRRIEDTPDIWLCVNTGSVAVSVEGAGKAPADSVIVDAGLGINILGGNRLTEPKEYSWTKDLNWNTDPSKGSVRDETSLDSVYSDLLDQDYD